MVLRQKPEDVLVLVRPELEARSGVRGTGEFRCLDYSYGGADSQILGMFYTFRCRKVYVDRGVEYCRWSRLLKGLGRQIVPIRMGRGLITGE